MKALSKLYLANLTEFMSNRRALFLTIAFPVLFIVIFGAVFTNQDKSDATIGIVVEEKDDAISAEIVKALESAPKGELTPDGKVQEKEREKNPFSELTFRQGTRAALVEDLKKGRLDAVITIPAGLAKQAAAVKERAMRDAAEQMEKTQREQMEIMPREQAAPAPGQAQTGAAGAATAASADKAPDADSEARARMEAMAAAHPEMMSDPRAAGGAGGSAGWHGKSGTDYYRCSGQA